MRWTACFKNGNLPEACRFWYFAKKNFPFFPGQRTIETDVSLPSRTSQKMPSPADSQQPDWPAFRNKASAMVVLLDNRVLAKL
jgi:hypothetical protein